MIPCLVRALFLSEVIFACSFLSRGPEDREKGSWE